MNISNICLFLALGSFWCCKSNPKSTVEDTKSHEEVVCKQSTVFEYHGLTGTDGLTQLLTTSTKPFIKGLNDSTKQSLIKFLQFENGMLEKMNGTDDNITNFYATAAYEVLKEILNSEVIMCTLETKPKVTFISMEEFEDLKLKTTAISYLSSWCTDCNKDETTPCCVAPGPGCRDNLIKIDQEYYSVKQ